MLKIILFSLLLIVYCQCKNNYKITELGENSGLFYQQIGYAKLTSDEFTLISFVNISVYDQVLNLIERAHAKSHFVCNLDYNSIHFQSKTETNLQVTHKCKQRINRVSFELKNLKEKFESIKHLTGHGVENENKRKKRGLFNGVSSGIKWLFGTPDANDAQYYSDAIKRISQQNHDVQLLMKQQIHVISDAIDSYNNSISLLKINEAKLNKNIQVFNDFSNKTSFKINQLTMTQSIESHFSQLYVLCQHLDQKFDTVISTILFSKQNVLHPSIITPKHLRNELLKIKLQGALEFPINPEHYDEIYKYTTISKLTVIYINNVFIFAIKIPLVTKELYQLYNVIPLPVQVPNSTIYSYIEPKFPYLLMSISRTYYGEMKDLTTCLQVPPGDFICSQVTEYLLKERSSCETLMKINPTDKIPEVCETRTVKSELQIWHRIGPNDWLFILTLPTLASVTCSDNVQGIEDTRIKGVGIFNMKGRCKCFTSSAILISSSNQTANYTNYIPPINILDDDCCFEKQEFLKTANMDSIKLDAVNLDGLSHAKQKLDQFDEILQHEINQPLVSRYSQWYNTIIGIFTTILITLAIFWVCCKCCKCCKCSDLIKWFRRIFPSGETCKNIICINSHNSVSSSSIHSTRDANPTGLEIEDDEGGFLTRLSTESLNQIRTDINSALASYSASPKRRPALKKSKM